MPSIRQRIRDHPVTTFFIGAYAFTWAIWFPLLIAYERGQVTLTPTITAVFVLGSFGPLFTAVVVTYLTGGSVEGWFSQVLRWRVAPRWWLAAFGLPVFLYGLMAAVHLALGGTLDWGEVNPLPTIPTAYLTIFCGAAETRSWAGVASRYRTSRNGTVHWRRV